MIGIDTSIAKLLWDKRTHNPFLVHEVVIGGMDSDHGIKPREEEAIETGDQAGGHFADRRLYCGWAKAEILSCKEI
jgi:hypothetical protein